MAGYPGFPNPYVLCGAYAQIASFIYLPRSYRFPRGPSPERAGSPSSVIRGLFQLPRSQRVEVYYICGPTVKYRCRQGCSCTVSLPLYSTEIFLTPLCIQRLAAQGDTIRKALFRGVCWDAVHKHVVHSGLHLRIRGELPGRRCSRPIQ